MAANSILFKTILLVAISLIALQCGCQAQVELEWWQKTVILQIYPRSFMDSDNDGTGDLKGIQSRLDHLVELGIKSIWLNPIYQSPMKDYGYDISDFKAVDPLFGTMEDFDDIIAEIKSRGMNLLLDFVPNHSSDQHEWFQLSRNRTDPYTDYYVWVDCIEPSCTEPPNNWLSGFGGTAWMYDPLRGQFYYHQFLPEQPDLNYRSPYIITEMQNALSFWLDKGVDGFRVDAIDSMFEAEHLMDEPLSGDPNSTPFDSGYLLHIYTKNQPEIFTVVAGWRDVLNTYDAQDGKHRFMMVEYDNDNSTWINAYYGNETNILMDFPFNFKLFALNANSTGFDIYDRVTLWLDNKPEFAWPNWLTGNHDSHRIANRTHAESIDAYNMLTLLLGGTTISYQGEEFGMLDTFLSYNESKDPQGCVHNETDYWKYSRDYGRTPIQWNSDVNAGFSKANETWLPVNENYVWLNAEAQKPDPMSHFNIYKRLVQLRDEYAFMYGTVEYPVVTEKVFSWTRVTPGHTGYVIIINVQGTPASADLFHSECCSFFTFPDEGFVVVEGNTKVGPTKVNRIAPQGSTRVGLSNVPLEPYKSLVIAFEPIFN